MAQTTLKQRQIAGGLDGWIPAGETWTYASADDPTFTFTVAADVTTKYSAGMKIKLTQGTVKYFIITAVSTFTGGNTTITVYGGTDYDLTSATITENYYSTQKAPFGFPMSPAKWSVEVVDTSSRVQGTPTNATWYNLGTTARQISIPIGVWVTYYKTDVWASATAGRIDIYSTLSTANNSSSDNDFTCRGIFNSVELTGLASNATKNLAIAAKTTYYLNYKVSEATSPTFLGSDGTAVATVIRATCAYL
jgi:hypothetical protein